MTDKQIIIKDYFNILRDEYNRIYCIQNIGDPKYLIKAIREQNEYIQAKEQECEQLRNKLNLNIERMNEQNEKLHDEIQVIRQQMKTILMVTTNGKYRPVKNSTKEQCYQVLGNIQELLKTNIITITERSNNATKNIHTKRESR